MVLVGPAGSGKSTFAHRHFRPTEVVSSDRCRAMIADDESSLAVSGRAFALFHEILRHRLELGRLAVADSTAVSPRARADLRALAGRCGAPVYVIAFDTPLEVCVMRDAGRDRRVGREVIERQHQMMQEALRAIPKEGYDGWWVLDEAAQEEAAVEVVGRRPPEPNTEQIKLDYWREAWRGDRR